MRLRPSFHLPKWEVVTSTTLSASGGICRNTDGFWLSTTAMKILAFTSGNWLPLRLFRHRQSQPHLTYWWKLRSPRKMKLHPLTSYYEDTWIRRPIRRAMRLAPSFPHSLWNCYQATANGNASTNNAVEGWQKRFSSLFGADHPTIWKLIDAIKQEQCHRNEVKSARRRHTSSALSQKVQELWSATCASYWKIRRGSRLRLISRNCTKHQASILKFWL